MDRLDKLITSLDKKDPKQYRDLNLVRRTLIELRDMVGNEETKEQIASQVNKMIYMKEHGEMDGSMLHTVIFGSPGVGKTKLGCKIGAIYYGLGYLKEGSKFEGSPSIQEMQENGMFSAVFLIIILLTLMWTPLVYLYKFIGVWIFLIGFVALLIAGMILYKMRDSFDKIDGGVASSAPDHADIVKVVSGEDFIAGYLGQTALKTKVLLNSCLGRVLFIDEAYSMLGSDPIGDQFGMEAATCLNRFMSEHPNEIVVIFAGYEKQIKEGLFKKQPGIARRCMFHINIPDYTSKELFQIFSRQMSSKGWTIDRSDKVLDLFEENYDAFPSFGGDCERLVNFCLTEHINRAIENESTQKDDKILMYDEIQAGVNLLRKNNIHKSKVEERGLDLNSLFSHMRPQIN